MMWTLALVSALALPALSLALPRWQLPLVTVTRRRPRRPVAAVERSAALPLGVRRDRAAHASRPHAAASDRGDAAASRIVDSRSGERGVSRCRTSRGRTRC